MWEDFSSDSYRNMPNPGPIKFFNPYKGENGDFDQFTPRHKSAVGVPNGGGGVGYYRVPTLISVWATAPFLHNNSLGLFNNNPSVDGRLDAFDDAIRKLLWPEKRLESSSYNGATPERLKADHGLIWRTDKETYLTIDAKRVPHFAARLPFFSKLYTTYPWLVDVWPLWLPTVLFLGACFVLLMLSKYDRARAVGIALFVCALVLFVILTAARHDSERHWPEYLTSVQPSWLIPLVLISVALPLALPFSPKWRRWIGYAAGVVGLGIGSLVYFNAGHFGDLKIGPIPKGTPVNLLANFNPDSEDKTKLQSLRAAIDGLAEIDSHRLKADEAQHVLKTKVAPALMEVNKCPDFVMDKGHYYDWFKSMTDDDKEALIELLKTF